MMASDDLVPDVYSEWRAPAKRLTEVAGELLPLCTTRRGTSLQLIVAFLLGLGVRLQVQVIGFLPLSEVAVLAVFPFLLPRYTARGALRCTRLLIPLGLLWLAFTLATDLYRETNPSLAARGVARAAVLLACIPFATVFFGRDTYRRLIAFTLGAIPSVILSAYVLRGGVHLGREMTYGRSEINFETHWVALTVFIAQLFNLLIYYRYPLLAYLGSLAAGASIFLGGSRAAGAAFSIGTPMVWFRNQLASRRQEGRMNALSVVLFAALSLAAVWAVLATYGFAAAEGYLGERAKRKYDLQSSTSVGLVLTARIELAGGWLAILDSPILGHGSWKLDTDRYFARAINWLEIDADPAFYYKNAYPLIPSHSHVVGAWVESGLGGGIFWIYAALLAVQVLYRPLYEERHLRLWASCSATALLWHIIFSPISSRLETAVSLAVFLTQMDAAAKAMRSSSAVPPAWPSPTSGSDRPLPEAEARLAAR